MTSITEEVAHLSCTIVMEDLLICYQAGLQSLFFFFSNPTQDRENGGYNLRQHSCSPYFTDTKVHDTDRLGSIPAEKKPGRVYSVFSQTKPLYLIGSVQAQLSVPVDWPLSSILALSVNQIHS